MHRSKILLIPHPGDGIPGLQVAMDHKSRENPIVKDEKYYLKLL